MDEKNVKEGVSRMRQPYLEIRYCFSADGFQDQMKQMMEMLIYVPATVLG